VRCLKICAPWIIVEDVVLAATKRLVEVAEPELLSIMMGIIWQRNRGVSIMEERECNLSG
jgi:hypothetical protein